MKEKKLNLKKHLNTVVMLNSDYLNLLDLMQITNANFPIGTFSHSFGVETYIRKDIVFDGESLIKALLLYMNEQLLHGDLLAIYQIFKLLPKQKINAI